MTTAAYTVRAERWDGGWELHVAGLGVTQSRTLATAKAEVRDFIETSTGTPLDEERLVFGWDAAEND